MGLLAFVFFEVAQAQNLVPNPSFEIFTGCPSSFSQLPVAAPWSYTPSSSASSDFIHSCGNPIVGVPNNAFGNQLAATGDGYVGFYAASTVSTLLDYREYAQVKLTSPLVAGFAYHVELKWSLGDNSALATDRLGVYLSSSIPSGSGIYSPINAVPQISNPLGNFLNDNVNWTTLSGVFIATGGEEFLVVGNFFDAINTALVPSGGSNPYVYFYVDDVIVEWIPTALIISGNNVICAGDSTTLTYAGGDTLVSWVNISNPANIISIEDTLTIAPTVTTTYIANGFNNNDTFTVTVLPPPPINLGNDTTICQGSMIGLVATHPGVSYLWQDNSTLDALVTSNPGLYWVELTDTNGCSNSDSIHISVAPLPVFNLGNDTTLCQGESMQLNANLAGAQSYAWQNASTGSTLNVNAANTYWVDVTVNGCTERDSIVVNYTPLPVVNIGNDTTICANASITLNAAAGGGSYLWSTGETTSNMTTSNPNTYWVAVTVNNCTSVDSLELDTAVIPQFTLPSDTSVCPGKLITLDATTPAANYLWHDGYTGTHYQAKIPGTYWVEVTSYGCVARDSFVLTNFVTPPLDLGANLQGCHGDLIPINALTLGAVHYEWTDYSTDPILVVNASGEYAVTITDVNNCKTADELVVTLYPYPLIDLGSDTTICTGIDWILTAPVSGATYSWSDGTSKSHTTVTPPDSVWVDVTLNNCTARDSIVVYNYNQPSIQLGNDSVLCPGAVLSLDVFSPEIVEYQWQDNSENASFVVKSPGKYWVRIKDQNCYNTDTLFADYHVLPTIDLGNDTVVCIGNPLVLDASVASDAYYQWQDGSQSSALVVEERGNYHVTVEHLCATITDSIFVDQCQCSVFVPNTFTPNKDGINERFQTYSDCIYTDYQLQIFDRWGQLIFSSNNSLEGWDGFIGGQPAQNGIYTWKLFYETEFLDHSSSEDRIGRVKIIR